VEERASPECDARPRIAIEDLEDERAWQVVSDKEVDNLARDEWPRGIWTWRQFCRSSIGGRLELREPEADQLRISLRNKGRVLRVEEEEDVSKGPDGSGRRTSTWSREVSLPSTANKSSKERETEARTSLWHSESTPPISTTRLMNFFC
jgi:hypothetical protein